MNKKIVVVSSTPRVNGNSEILSKEFIKGAKESGNGVTLISIRDFKFKILYWMFILSKQWKMCFKG